MAYLSLILISLALAAGFLALTAYETERGVRFFGDFRMRLDRDVERVEFIIANVDLAAFLRDEIERLAHKIGHDIAHLTLQVVRAAERLLTRTVRHLRTKESMDAPREASREFVKTLSDFKGHLEATRPEVPSVHDVP